MPTSDSQHLYAVIMAGGGGTRLWPASRRRRAKQFLALGTAGGRSLLGATVHRMRSVCDLDRTLVVAAASQVPDVQAALPELPAANLLAEPCGRNTAPCIGFAAEALFARDPAAVLAVLPADHHIANEAAFADVVTQVLALAGAEDRIVTLGVRPTRPETGYGYIRTSAAPTHGIAYDVEAFVEKPDGVTARRYLESGRYLWNSGMFFFTAARIRAELRRHLPDMTAAFDAIGAACAGGGDATPVVARVYPGLRAISIDYGVMEKADGILVAPAEFGWNDVGSWTALSAISEHDADGNVTVGETLLRRAHDNVVVTESGQLVSVVGADGLVVVVTRDAILVCPKDHAQEVRDVVAELERRGLDRYL
ncbi:MAG: mannose-1-phosphate guanylyltransferase [Deltaproteobacteria bacterium]|nr:mannose-1-phosphate guanylyltransferase [Deltaproteobacteria bacterium]